MSESERNLNSGGCNDNESTSKQKETIKQPPRLGLEWFDAKRFLQVKHDEYIYKAITNAFQSGIWWMREYSKVKGNITDKDLYEPLNITQGTYKVWKHSHVNWDSFKGWAAPKGRPKSHYNGQIVSDIVDSSPQALDTATITEKVNEAREEDRKRPISDDQVRNVQKDENITPKLPSKITHVFDQSLYETRRKNAQKILNYLNDDKYFVIYIDESQYKVGHDSRTKQWSRAGTPALIDVMPSKAKFTITQACSKDEAIFSSVFTGNTTGVSFSEFQDGMFTAIAENEINVVYEYINGKRKRIVKEIVIIVDNAPIHGLRFIDVVLHRHNAIVQYQPKYCPWANLVESAFSRLKHYLNEARRSLGANPSDDDIMRQVFSIWNNDIQNLARDRTQPQNSSSSSSSSSLPHPSLNTNIISDQAENTLNNMNEPPILTENIQNDEPINQNYLENILENEEEYSDDESYDHNEDNHENSGEYSAWHTWVYTVCRRWMAYDNHVNTMTKSFISAKSVLERIIEMPFDEAIKHYRYRRKKE